MGLLFAIFLASSGCAVRSAPTWSLFGSYFPMWMPCGVLGVAASAMTHFAIVASGLSGAIPAHLLVCASVGIIVACVAWLWLGL